MRTVRLNEAQLRSVIKRMINEHAAGPFPSYVSPMKPQFLPGSEEDLEEQISQAIDEKDTEKLMYLLEQMFGSEPDPESAINDFLVANGYGDMASEILHMYFGEDY